MKIWYYDIFYEVTLLQNIPCTTKKGSQKKRDERRCNGDVGEANARVLLILIRRDARVALNSTTIHPTGMIVKLHRRELIKSSALYCSSYWTFDIKIRTVQYFLRATLTSTALSSENLGFVKVRYTLKIFAYFYFFCTFRILEDFKGSTRFYRVITWRK